MANNTVVNGLLLFVRKFGLIIAVAAFGSCNFAGSDDEVETPSATPLEEKSTLAFEPTVETSDDQASSTRGFMYPYSSMLGNNIYYNGNPIHAYSSCCQGKWEYPSTEKTKLNCRDGSNHNLKIGVEIDNRILEGMEGYFSSNRYFFLSINGLEIKEYAMLNAKPGKQKEYKNFMLSKLFQNSFNVDLLAYSCSGRYIDIIIEVDSLLHQGWNRPVAVDRGNVFHLNYNVTENSLSIVELSNMTLEYEVRKAREKLLIETNSNLDVNCPLNLWPCDQAEREHRVTQEMKKAFGNEEEPSFPPVDKLLR